METTIGLIWKNNNKLNKIINNKNSISNSKNSNKTHSYVFILRVVKNGIHHYMKDCTETISEEQKALFRTFAHNKSKTAPSTSTHRQTQHKEDPKEDSKSKVKTTGRLGKNWTRQDYSIIYHHRYGCEVMYGLPRPYWRLKLCYYCTQIICTMSSAK